MQYILDEPYASQLRDGKLKTEELSELERKYNNVVVEIQITLDVVKPRPERA